jgi:hypothetical protein
MVDFIKKRKNFFSKDELVEFEKVKSLMECVAWHMRFTPWFNDEVNVLLAKEDWARKEESQKKVEGENEKTAQLN